VQLTARPLTRRTKNSPFRRPRKEADETFDRAGKFNKNYFLEENYNYPEWYLDQAKKITTRMFRYIYPKENWIFLDVGCALGGMVELLRRRGYEAYGIDLSRWCLRTSPVKRYLHFGSATNLPCADQSIDVSTCFDTLQYLTQKEVKQAAKELRRVTRKYLCIECIAWEDEKYSDPEENPDTVRKHKSLLTRDEYIELFKKAGFRLKKKSFLPRHIRGKLMKSASSEYGEYYEYDFSFNAVFEVE
jgi:ubiquinone/menaquinone biosynthesis C-methylase UbiE